MLALIAYALFWAYLSALFVEHMVPLEVETRPVGTGLRDIPPECWAAPDLYDCANFREAK